MNDNPTDRSHGDLRLLSRADPDRAGPSRILIPPPRLRWRTRILIPGIVLLAGAGLLAYAARDALVRAMPVTVMPVVAKAAAAGATGAAGAIVQAPGWVEAEPYAVSVSALTDGIVKQVLVLEGEHVSAGQVVARLVDDDAKLALAKAEAELRQRQADLGAAKRRWEDPVELTRAVAVAEAKLAQTQAELTRLEAEVAAESARVDAAREESKRASQAFQTNAATELEMLVAKARLNEQVATLSATQQRRPMLEAQVRQEQAELTAARDNLKLRIEDTKDLAVADAVVALATAARDEAKLRLDRTEVRSPADGVVMQRLVEPGSKLMAGMDDAHSAHVVRLFDPKRLQVRVDVPLADAAKVGVGQSALIVVGVLPDRTFDGKVIRIVNEADLQKNTLQVKVAITNPSEQLKPEMLARVKMITSTPTTNATGGATTALWIPESLVQRHGEHARVWLADSSDNVARMRDVALGAASHDGWVLVESGLNLGDRLIAGDTSLLRDGARIRITGEAPDLSAAAAKGGNHAAH